VIFEKHVHPPSVVKRHNVEKDNFADLQKHSEIFIIAIKQLCCLLLSVFSKTFGDKINNLVI